MTTMKLNAKVAHQHHWRVLPVGRHEASSDDDTEVTVVVAACLCGTACFECLDIVAKTA